MEIDQSLGIKRQTTFDTIVLVGTVGMFATLIVLASSQVLVRNLNLPISLPWTEPTSRYLLIVATYFGAAVASRNDEHVRMSYLLEKLERRAPRVTRWVDVINTTVVVAFVGFIAYGTLLSMSANWNSDIGGIGFLTSGYVYLGIALGLGSMLVYELLGLRTAVDRIRTANPDQEG
ncbi:TRAP-type C4-dicarboxylate transport system, small permease component [Halopenitus malekzadehii]|uniref:TRAP-type C4-dicarboxylate transport system, small permease component n=1 Tax=Halopenitus malekzadehii TaxID=1267564 RepID=A0A1H6IKW9_9EURY|nr:TRAP transporter small permease [Halopenitus malekzadehii]SEH50178.1 TRAP-type C4-dicarboxylate transport system, small permease component [Halopenitus malekzadehii]